MNSQVSRTNAAVIDLGFNSVKMVCYTVDRNGNFRPFRQDAFMARLGEGLDETGYLGEAQMKRTISYLRALRDIAQLESVSTIIPVATSAVREASNGSEFLREVRAGTRLSFRVLSERDEALYSFAGAVGFAPEPNVVFFDLGGGSLEIVCASGFRIWKTTSLPLGSLRVSMEFEDDKGAFSKQSIKKMKGHIAEALPKWLASQTSRKATLVGAGGTVRAMARYDQELNGYPFAKVQSYRIPYGSVNSITKSLLKKSRRELEKLNAVGNRSDSIAAGALVVKMLMKHLGSRELRVSSYGLREGTLSMYLRNQKLFHSGREPRAEVERLVTESARRLHRASEGNQLSFEKVGLLGRREAALLAEAYLLVSRVQPSVNLRSYFLSLLEEDSLFTHREQLKAAVVVIATRKGRMADSLMDEFAEFLPEEAKLEVGRLAAIYSFLETSDRAGVRVRASRHGRDIEIEVVEAGIAPRSLLAHQAEEMSEKLGLGVALSFTQSRKETMARGRVQA
jgi:exopolyphosphatase/guanosine-5'-triphosphate,3'-diphosphate pyrophosphatase